MYRAAMEKLYKWKDSKRRKPLIIEGARQVGKTWLMKEFGRTAYADAVYINFDSNSVMADQMCIRDRYKPHLVKIPFIRKALHSLRHAAYKIILFECIDIYLFK